MFPGEVFANTADFDTGIRQLLPRYDEMLDVLVRCIPSTAQSILELGCGTGEKAKAFPGRAWERGQKEKERKIFPRSQAETGNDNLEALPRF